MILHKLGLREINEGYNNHCLPTSKTSYGIINLNRHKDVYWGKIKRRLFVFNTRNALKTGSDIKQKANLSEKINALSLSKSYN